MTRHTRFASRLATLVALAAGAACMPLPPEDAAHPGVDVGLTDDTWSVQMDPVLATPLSLVNRITQPLPPGKGGELPVDEDAAVAAFWAVIHDRPQWFPLRAGLDDFRLVRSDAQGFVRILRMGQFYKGVQLAGFGYEVHVLGNGRVGTLEGRYYPNLTLDVRPTYSVLSAEDKARALFVPNAVAAAVPSVQFEYRSGFSEPRVLTVITPVGNQPVLAWAVVVPANSRDFARVYVDATNGSLLAREFVGWSGMR